MTEKNTNASVSYDFSDIKNDELRTLCELVLNDENDISKKRMHQAYAFDRIEYLELFRIDCPDMTSDKFINNAFKFVNRSARHRVRIVGKSFELDENGVTEWAKRNKSGKVLKDFSFNACYEICTGLHTADMTRAEARNAVRDAFTEGGVLDKVTVFTSVEEIRKCFKVSANDTNESGNKTEANGKNQPENVEPNDDGTPNRATYKTAMETLKKAINGDASIDVATANTAWLTVCAYVSTIDNGYNASK